jgi:hypothetical protein
MLDSLTGCSEAVSRLFWEQEAVGSIPTSPIKNQALANGGGSAARSGRGDTNLLMHANLLIRKGRKNRARPLFVDSHAFVY